ncbi:MAG: hypothetical protein GY711_14610 [bacterium]|nr:hypothetical protein [bacterium]
MHRLQTFPTCLTACAAIALVSFAAPAAQEPVATQQQPVLREYERALARARSEGEYYATLLESATSLREGDSALTWLRDLTQWAPAEPAHHRVLGQLLQRKREPAAAAEAFAKGAEVLGAELQLEFDDKGRVLWDPLRATDPDFARRVRTLHAIVAEAVRGYESSGDEAAASWEARAESLQLRLAGEPDPGATPQQLEGGRRYQTRVLERSLGTGHPTDRRLAASFLVERLARGRINERRAHDVAGLLLEQQAHLGRAWVPDLGEAFERLWARGVLDAHEIETYLSQALPTPRLALRTIETEPARYAFSAQVLPHVAAAGGEEPYVISARVDWSDATVDGAAIALGGSTELANLRCDAPAAIPLTLLPERPLSAGRHVLEVTCLVMIEAMAEGQPTALGGTAAILRVPFLAP